MGLVQHSGPYLPLLQCAPSDLLLSCSGEMSRMDASPSLIRSRAFRLSGIDSRPFTVTQELTPCFSRFATWSAMSATSGEMTTVRLPPCRSGKGRAPGNRWTYRRQWAVLPTGPGPAWPSEQSTSAGEFRRCLRVQDEIPRSRTISSAPWWDRGAPGTTGSRATGVDDGGCGMQL